MFRLQNSQFSSVLTLVVSLWVSAMAMGSNDKLPDRLEGVGVQEMLDTELPLNVKFMDHDGANVTFGDLLADGKPLILTLNYSDCPGLCVSQLNGLVRGVNGVGSLRLGQDFKMVSLSINPRESRERAAATHERYSDDLANHHKSDGWRFLIGTEPDIQKIAKAVGFNYTYDAKHDRYNHASVAVFVSPKGRLTRYLYDVGFTGETLKMALLEAGEGTIGTTLDAFVLMCFHYDANENRYSANAKTLLSVAAGVFVTVGLAAMLPFWISRKRFRKPINAPQVSSHDNQ
jgi:protein SCO1/2